MATLYRKYRPQCFKEVVGQNHIKIALEYELKTNQLAHSYLFCGPRAVGKTTLARVLAKSLNCLNRQPGDAEPCNECVACKSISAGNAIDMIEIDAASHTGVDNVRENIIAGARISPSSLAYKIFIIDEVHMLSTAAFNALLKIMEEPPAFVVFILCTTEVHKIPSTIISRCQRFDFKKISVTDIVRKLEFVLKAEGISADKEVLESIARYSGGHMRDAESALGQVISLSEMPATGGLLTITKDQAELVIPKNDLEQAVTLLEFLAARDAANAIRLINSVLDDGFDLKVFWIDVIEITRQMMIIKINPELIAGLGVDLGETLTAKILKIVDRVSVDWLIKALKKILEAKNSFKDDVFQQLPLEIAVIEIADAQIIHKNIVHEEVLPEKKEYVNVSLESEPKNIEKPTIVASASFLNDWPRVMAVLKERHPALFFAFRLSKPREIEDNKLSLVFKHKIHRDRIAEQDVKQKIENILEEIYNRKMFLETILDETIDLDSNEEKNVLSSADQAIDDVLKNFGGRIVG
ncbi:MAG: DNA polymerase III subunit gamma/tau [Patescibacteria group bacterium]|nr:DNA polymerase III subunit gamma/tau [Patescibacteria group bacterium]